MPGGNAFGGRQLLLASRCLLDNLRTIGDDLGHWRVEIPPPATTHASDTSRLLNPSDTSPISPPYLRWPIRCTASWSFTSLFLTSGSGPWLISASITVAPTLALTPVSSFSPLPSCETAVTKPTTTYNGVGKCVDIRASWIPFTLNLKGPPFSVPVCTPAINAQNILTYDLACSAPGYATYVASFAFHLGETDQATHS